MEKNLKYLHICNFAIHLKHCKSSILQFLKIKLKKKETECQVNSTTSYISLRFTLLFWTSVSSYLKLGFWLNYSKNPSSSNCVRVYENNGIQTNLFLSVTISAFSI